MIYFFINEGQNFNIEIKTRKASKKNDFSGNEKSFFDYFMNLYYDFSILLSTNQKLSKFTVFPCFLHFYWWNTTVFTQIICEYYNQFNIVFQISHIIRYVAYTKSQQKYVGTSTGISK